MRLRTFVAAGVLMAASLAARADSVSLTFANPVQNGLPGQTVDFYGTISAPLSNTNAEILGSAPITLPTNGSGTYIQTTYLGPPFYPDGFRLQPGQSITGVLVRVELFYTDYPYGLFYGPPGLYTGSLQLAFDEGTPPQLVNNFDTPEEYFSVNIPAAATTPEPSSFILIGTGLLGLTGVLRRRVNGSRQLSSSKGVAGLRR